MLRNSFSIFSIAYYMDLKIPPSGSKSCQFIKGKHSYSHCGEFAMGLVFKYRSLISCCSTLEST